MNKMDILKEIMRTAASNGGAPLGWRRFASETGIREADWLGKHWARWNDAVREAGLSPNRLTEAYTQPELLETLSQLAQELGRLPTSADLRLRTHTHPGFPSDRPFRRLGGKSKIVRLLAEYCRNREEYKDVLRLCARYVSPKLDIPDGPRQGQLEFGEVYLMKSGRYYKIGKTNAWGRRKYELEIQLPEKLRTVHVIRTDDPSGIEDYWHKRFAGKRVKGEWFDLDPAEVAAFKRRKFM